MPCVFHAIRSANLSDIYDRAEHSTMYGRRRCFARFASGNVIWLWLPGAVRRATDAAIARFAITLPLFGPGSNPWSLSRGGSGS